MTQGKDKGERTNGIELMGNQEDFLRLLVRELIQQLLETVGTGKGERTAERVGYRAGYNFEPERKSRTRPLLFMRSFSSQDQDRLKSQHGGKEVLGPEYRKNADRTCLSQV